MVRWPIANGLDVGYLTQVGYCTNPFKLLQKQLLLGYHMMQFN
jgi:hypothetical protein